MTESGCSKSNQMNTETEHLTHGGKSDGLASEFRLNMPDAVVKQARKLLDWKAWFTGMYVNAIRAGSGAMLGFVGSNVAEGLAPEALKNLGLSWKQALLAGGCALLIEVLRYINAKPLPDERSIESGAPFPPMPGAK